MNKSMDEETDSLAQQTYIMTDRQTYKQTDRQTYKQTDRQTDRQTYT